MSLRILFTSFGNAAKSPVILIIGTTHVSSITNIIQYLHHVEARANGLCRTVDKAVDWNKVAGSISHLKASS